MDRRSARRYRSRRSFEEDRVRDATLQEHGWRMLRITDRRLHEDPGVIADIRHMLANQ